MKGQEGEKMMVEKGKLTKTDCSDKRSVKREGEEFYLR